MPPGQATVSPHFTANDRGHARDAETVRRPAVDNPGTSLMAIMRYVSACWRIVLPAAALAIVAPLPAAAQNAAAAPVAEPWTKLCNTDAATKKELCLVIQELKADTGQFIASATIRQVTGEEKISFIAAVPPGMLLQPGLRAQIDDGKQYEIKYGICFPNACYGELEVNAEFVEALKAGSKLTITTVTPQAKGVTFPMTLVGFTKAYDGEGLDAAAAKARQDELNKALQLRAEEARKKLIEQQQKEGGQTN
jgi:invasion protein IalB